jgi:hypothetical protein
MMKDMKISLNHSIKTMDATFTKHQLKDEISVYYYRSFVLYTQ